MLYDDQVLALDLKQYHTRSLLKPYLYLEDGWIPDLRSINEFEALDAACLESGRAATDPCATAPASIGQITPQPFTLAPAPNLHPFLPLLLNLFLTPFRTLACSLMSVYLVVHS